MEKVTDRASEGNGVNEFKNCLMLSLEEEGI
jgi:hypothetical protein